MKKVSIIVPIYNGEKFVERCIESLLQQDYHNIEILLINDGSTDKTSEIIGKYKDDRIKVYNNSNKGVSYSRNYGIEMSTGEYIMFVDVDDILATNAVSQLLNIIDSNDVEIIKFNYYEEDERHKLTQFEFKNEGIDFCSLTDKEKINTILGFYSDFRCYCWSLFMKRDKVKPFNEKLKYLEDTLFYLENYMQVDNKICFIDKPLYIYKYNEQSVTKSSRNYFDKIRMMLESYIEIKGFCSTYNYPEKLLNMWILNLIFYRLEYVSRSISYKEFKSLLWDIYRYNTVEKIMKNIDIKQMRANKKINYFMFKYKMFYFMYCQCKFKDYLKKLKCKK